MPQSDYVPQLATLVKEPPSGDEWVHEIKYDGYRIGCRIKNGRVSLISRNGKDWTASFPEVAEAAGDLGVDDTLLDGEVAMVLADGRSSFQALQNAASSTARRSIVYFVFDLLRVDGERLESLPLDARKERLRALLGRRSGRIRYASHVEGKGREFFDQACRTGLEGIISKRRDLPYKPGRHGGWVKTKCIQRQELVVGGFTDPEGMRAGIGALLVGYYDDKARLVFAGKVGTGFTQKSAIELRSRLDAIERSTSPFDPAPERAIAKRAHWVRPELVCEVVFTEWTSDGRIRHPSFQGLRRDKKAVEVRRESPAEIPEVDAKATPPAKARGRARPQGTARARPSRQEERDGTPRRRR